MLEVNPICSLIFISFENSSLSSEIMSLRLASFDGQYLTWKWIRFSRLIISCLLLVNFARQSAKINLVIMSPFCWLPSSVVQRPDPSLYLHLLIFFGVATVLSRYLSLKQIYFAHKWTPLRPYVVKNVPYRPDYYFQHSIFIVWKWHIHIFSICDKEIMTSWHAFQVIYLKYFIVVVFYWMDLLITKFAYL